MLINRKLRTNHFDYISKTQYSTTTTNENEFLFEFVSDDEIKRRVYATAKQFAYARRNWRMKRRSLVCENHENFSNSSVTFGRFIQLSLDVEVRV